MPDCVRLTAIRVLPLLLLTIAAAAWINDVQEGGPWVYTLVAGGIGFAIGWIVGRNV